MNGWDDLFLPGADFRQFLLAEQARVEAVLRRLAAADTAPSARFTMAVTPTTMPNATVAVFGLLAAALVVSRRRNRAPIAVAASNSRSGAAILGVTLLYSRC